ncbi:serine--tRNA ligase [Oenococcus oeni]|uniref:Serine--tRNA ligase n=3 Tax=Oenococcus oeni TaxID=1247 RepID=A0NL36_OENOE|nr:serine--tRNA ligase [Oenococcus oeni]EAV38707.1 seryl-tRNA synthetase [Oenococcus oeni ATCC BAA-1163]AVI93688.1 serine--tRNA ligase [Oenococcus oeni]EJO02192.1 seryl-tRNA synthetase [Oenococcus oeni AWRIB418]KDE87670.1 serine--tRNA ligase [Oenococcus oeni]KEP88068.1 seryl-tRNA synthetase [Oenococcus oeni IOEB_0501]
MLDIKYLRNNRDEANQRLIDRNVEDGVLDKLLADDEKRRSLIRKAEQLKAKRNQVSDQIGAAKRAKDNSAAQKAISDMQTVADQIKDLDKQLSAIEESVHTQAAHLPNLADPRVPVGPDDSYNVEQRKWQPTDLQGRPAAFSKTPTWLKAHFEIGEDLGILDFQRGAKVSGARFLYYVGAGARLERAVYNFMLDEHRREGYTELLTPYMVTNESMYATGQFPKFVDDAYEVGKNQSMTMIPTAEVALVNWRRDEVLDESELPLYITALSPAFRQEAGAAGKDTRGLIRLHQFNKVEMVKFTKPEDSYNELEKMTVDAENILQKLELPYHVIRLSTGDMGFGSAMTYDLEVWFPTQDKYREISSVSNDEDFQARRGHIQYRDSKTGKLRFVHTLNGSGLAVGRTVAAILENYQNEDGTITIPEVLRPYFGEDKISKENAR